MWAFLRIVAGVIICIYLASIAGLYYFQRDLMYLPPRGVPASDMRALRGFEEISVMSGENMLHAWYLPPTKANAPVILAFHGNASHPAWIVGKLKPLARPLGVGIILAEYRGYGGNSGKPTEEGLIEDGKAYVRWFREQSQEGHRALVLYGESLGAAVAIHIASEARANALILEAPFQSALSMAQTHYNKVPKLEWLVQDQWRSDKFIQELTVPKLFLLAGNDRVVPPAQSEHLFELAPDPKEKAVLEGAGHNDMYKYGALPRVYRFVERLIKEGL